MAFKTVSLNSKTFLITGAAMGMGKLYAQRAVEAGASIIVLWDINAEKLEEAITELQAQTITNTAFHAITVDLTNPRSIAKAITATQKIFSSPDVLINNAGIVTSGLFWEFDPTKDIDNVIKVNTLAPLHITRAFLPDMIKNHNRPRRILNIASAAGTVSQPLMSVYASSKWAIIGWSDSLRIELEQTNNKHIRVTTVAPSFVNTGMFQGAKPPMFTPILEPDDIVDRGWKALAKGKPHVFFPPTVLLNRLLSAALPVRIYDELMYRAGVYDAMQEFSGHNRHQSAKDV